MDGGKTIGGMDFDAAAGLYVSGGCNDNTFAFGGVTPTLPANDFCLMFLARCKPDGTGDWPHFAHDITFQYPIVVADDLPRPAHADHRVLRPRSYAALGQYQRTHGPASFKPLPSPPRTMARSSPVAM